GGENLLDEVPGSIGVYLARRRSDAHRERRAAGIAKLLAPRIEGRTARADQAFERGPALATEASTFAVLVLAVRAPHSRDSAVRIASRGAVAVLEPYTTGADLARTRNSDKRGASPR